MLPSPEEIESAIEYGESVSNAVGDEGKFVKTALTILTALKSGELVDRCEMCQQSTKFEPEICEACKWNKITQGVAK